MNPAQMTGNYGESVCEVWAGRSSLLTDASSFSGPAAAAAAAAGSSISEAHFLLLLLKLTACFLSLQPPPPTIRLVERSTSEIFPLVCLLSHPSFVSMN